MTPAQVDALTDDDFAAMVRLMHAEAAAIEKQNRKLARKR
jgi:hypothetical protein